MNIVSSVHVRGSVPVLWSQTATMNKVVPPIELSSSDPEVHRAAFKQHIDALKVRYEGDISCLSLLSTSPGSEEDWLAQTFQNLCNNVAHPTMMLRYDLHANKSAEKLVDIMKPFVMAVGFDLVSEITSNSTAQSITKNLIMKQQGVVRTNCLDCLDRTNRAQTALFLAQLPQMLYALNVAPAQHKPVTQWFTEQWRLNGDALSMLSCGSDALTGQESAAEKARDISKSMLRFINDRFTVKHRETALCCLRFSDRVQFKVTFSDMFRHYSINEDYFNSKSEKRVHKGSQYNGPDKGTSQSAASFKVIRFIPKPEHSIMLAVTRIGSLVILINSVVPDRRYSICILLLVPRGSVFK
jgi:hypothetical protein